MDTCFTTPFSMVNSISVATSYPFGAATSCRTYVPSGSLLMVTASSPLVQLMDRLSLATITRSGTVMPSSVLPASAASFKVNVSSAPGSSSLPATAFLLISNVATVSFTKMAFFSKENSSDVKSSVFSTLPSLIVNSKIDFTNV